jgi:hypothetical protein
VNARKLGQNGARRIPQPGTRLPLLERFPQHISEKADQNVRLDAVLFMMPDRTDTQIGFLNAEGRLGFAELDVGLPQLLVSPVVDVAAKNVSAFTELGPIVSLRACAPLELDSRWRGLIFCERDRVARRGAGVSFQEPPDLAFQSPAIQRALALLDASAKRL